MSRILIFEKAKNYKCGCERYEMFVNKSIICRFDGKRNKLKLKLNLTHTLMTHFNYRINRFELINDLRKLTYLMRCSRLFYTHKDSVSHVCFKSVPIYCQNIFLFFIH